MLHFENYIIIDHLAQGGVGSIYRALRGQTAQQGIDKGDIPLQRVVIIKSCEA